MGYVSQYDQNYISSLGAAGPHGALTAVANPFNTTPGNLAADWEVIGGQLTRKAGGAFAWLLLPNLSGSVVSGDYTARITNITVGTNIGVYRGGYAVASIDYLGAGQFLYNSICYSPLNGYRGVIQTNVTDGATVNLRLDVPNPASAPQFALATIGGIRYEFPIDQLTVSVYPNARADVLVATDFGSKIDLLTAGRYYSATDVTTDFATSLLSFTSSNIQTTNTSQFPGTLITGTAANSSGLTSDGSTMTSTMAWANTSAGANYYGTASGQIGGASISNALLDYGDGVVYAGEAVSWRFQFVSGRGFSFGWHPYGPMRLEMTTAGPCGVYYYDTLFSFTPTIPLTAGAFVEVRLAYNGATKSGLYRDQNELRFDVYIGGALSGSVTLPSSFNGATAQMMPRFCQPMSGTTATVSENAVFDFLQVGKVRPNQPVADSRTYTQIFGTTTSDAPRFNVYDGVS